MDVRVFVTLCASFAKAAARVCVQRSPQCLSTYLKGGNLYFLKLFYGNIDNESQRFKKHTSYPLVQQLGYINPGTKYQPKYIRYALRTKNRQQ